MKSCLRTLPLIWLVCLLAFPSQVSSAQPSPNASSAPIPIDYACPLWNQAIEYGNIVYFVVPSAKAIKRYDMAGEKWLTSLLYSETPLNLAVDGTSLFVNRASGIFRSNLDGSGAVYLASGGPDLSGLIVYNQFLYPINKNGTILSLDKSTGALIAFRQIDTALGNNILVPQVSMIYGIHYGSFMSLVLNPDGTFGKYTRVTLDLAALSSVPQPSTNRASLIECTTTLPAYYGKIFYLPGKQQILNSFGKLYYANDLSLVGPLPTFPNEGVENVLFVGSQYVFLQNGKISGYDSDFGRVKEYYPLAPAQKISAYGGKIFAFSSLPDQIQAHSLPIRELGLTGADEPIDPNSIGFTFWPDVFQMGNDETLYMLSIARQHIFRWSVAQRKYLESIPLSGRPIHMTYASLSNCLYLAYMTGEITQICPDQSLEEIPFVTVSFYLHRLTSMGEYILAGGGDINQYSNSIQEVYDLQGHLIPQTLNPYFAHNPNVLSWDPTNQIFYFDFGNSGWLASASMDENAQIKFLRAYIDVGGVYFPRMWLKPDGTKILWGGGTLFNQADTTFIRLGGMVHGAAWSGSNLYAALESGGDLVLRKYDETYQPISETSLSANDAQLFSIQEGLLVVANRMGRPQMSIVGTDLSEQFDSAPRTVYFPMTGKTGVFLDDFSSGNGWPVYDDGVAMLGTFNGQYRIQTNKTNYFNAVVSPFPRAENYEIEIDAYFDSRGLELGLILDVTGYYDRFFLVEYLPDQRICALTLYDGVAFQELASAGNCGPGAFQKYHFKVTRNTSDKFSVEINGTKVLTSPMDYSLVPYVSRVGMFSVSKSNQGYSDARFDNFRLTILPGMIAPAYVPFSSPSGSSKAASISSITFNHPNP